MGWAAKGGGQPPPRRARFDRLVAVGEGSEGRTFRAWDRRSRAWVALACRRRSAPLPPSWLSLDHPALARILESTPRRAVRDWVPGRPLDEVRASPPLLAVLLRQALEGLLFLHAHGLVHGDVRAGNLIVDAGDRRPAARWIDPCPRPGAAPREDLAALAALFRRVPGLARLLRDLAKADAEELRLRAALLVERLGETPEPLVGLPVPAAWRGLTEFLGGPVSPALVEASRPEAGDPARLARWLRASSRSVAFARGRWDWTGPRARRLSPAEALATADRLARESRLEEATDLLGGLARRRTLPQGMRRRALARLFELAPAAGRYALAAEAALHLHQATGRRDLKIAAGTYFLWAGHHRRAARLLAGAPDAPEAIYLAGTLRPERVEARMLRAHRHLAPDVRLKRLAAVGGFWVLLGRYGRARRFFERAQRVDHPCGERSSLRLRSNLALCDLFQGFPAKAYAAFRRGLRASEKGKDETAVILTLLNLGDCALQMGRLTASESWFEAARSRARAIKDPVLRGMAAHDLSQVWLARADYDRAARWNGVARRFGGSVPPAFRLPFQAARAEIALFQGRISESVREIQSLSPQVNASPWLGGVLDVFRVAAMAFGAAGLWAEAERAVDRGGRIAEHAGDALARAQFRLLRRLVRGRKPVPGPINTMALVRAAERRGASPPGRAHAFLARSRQANGSRRALTFALRAYAEAQRLADHRLRALTAKRLAEIHDALDQPSVAMQYRREAHRRA